MPKIMSVGICPPEHIITQETVVSFAKELFGGAFKDMKRLLQVFENGQIKKRHFAKDLSWFECDHSFEEKNNTYIECAVEYGCEAIRNCLHNSCYLHEPVSSEDIDAFFFISSTGMATPTIDAKIMNILPFSPHTKRIPIWGLGCAGGAAGLSRAFEYCKAFPKAKVLVLAVELCSLTFQRNDTSKSNLIGTSLFADGIACVLIAGDEADAISKLSALPHYVDSQSTLMKNAEDVMGWDIRNEGLFVIFSKDIPTIIKSWLRPTIAGFLQKHNMTMQHIQHFIAHPGGKKVLEAYHEALGMEEDMTAEALQVLQEYGNMSSVTVLYVLDQCMKKHIKKGDMGVAAALGPGFSSEFVLLRWE
ncbi:3-oxoacyl-[acyl-carrier-protein] synthase III C-terminal domain-containing protein [Bacillus sp. 165]|uniref:type III polyketide synthase n=1 Tax=Bacillus sp. 165 TaxID=1529117 RepID=UPI001AD96EA0|nr:3-oxoacyl-[acyl-carrier-protein] synthase III C-terminal domain-containing protein [Bacillus sp. 165]MBO9128193.1 type III polyketide synthase [Bacillus sp. 165]